MHNKVCRSKSLCHPLSRVQSIPVSHPPKVRGLYPDESSADYGFVPFGGGGRRCVGDQFAMLESTVLLAMALRDFRFEAVAPVTLGMGATIFAKVPPSGGRGGRLAVKRRGGGGRWKDVPRDWFPRRPCPHSDDQWSIIKGQYTSTNPSICSESPWQILG